MTQLGQVIRDARTRRGMSQHSIGSLVGVPVHTFGLWEIGVRKPITSEIERIAEVLDIDLAKMLEVYDSDISSQENFDPERQIAYRAMVEAYNRALNLVNEEKSLVHGSTVYVGSLTSVRDGIDPFLSEAIKNNIIRGIRYVYVLNEAERKRVLRDLSLYFSGRQPREEYMSRLLFTETDGRELLDKLTKLSMKPDINFLDPTADCFRIFDERGTNSNTEPKIRGYKRLFHSGRVYYFCESSETVYHFVNFVEGELERKVVNV